MGEQGHVSRCGRWYGLSSAALEEHKHAYRVIPCMCSVSATVLVVFARLVHVLGALVALVARLLVLGSGHGRRVCSVVMSWGRLCLELPCASLFKRRPGGSRSKSRESSPISENLNSCLVSLSERQL